MLDLPHELKSPVNSSPKYTATVYQSLQEFWPHRDRWRDLWRRSGVSTPTVVLEHFEVYLRCFAPSSAGKAVVVEDPFGKFIGGVLLVDSPRRLGLRRTRLANNDWAECGSLLVDPQADTAEVVTAIVQKLKHYGTPLIELNGIRKQEAQLPCLESVLGQRGGYLDTKTSHETGVVPVDGPWESYEAGWSKSHRRNLKRREKRLMETGDLAFKIFEDLDVGDVRRILLRGFDLEARGWKGRAGTAVIQDKTALTFCLEQAEYLARRRRLRAFFLELDGQPIAFEYGWCAKGHYHSNKTTYDETYASSSPGQILFGKVLKHFARIDEYKGVDVQGPLTQAIEAWSPKPIEVLNVNVAVSPVGRVVLRGYDRLKMTVNSFH